MDLSTREYRFINETIDIEEDFTIKKGIDKIIISAPHSVTQMRNNKKKIGEFRTGVIAEILNESIGVNSIYKTKNIGDDANYDKVSNYKQSLERFIKDNEIEILIDLHISAPNREYDIDIGTAYGRNLKGENNILNTIESIFKEKGYDVQIDSTFTASYDHTIASYIARKSCIPTLQLEINWKCVDDDIELYRFINVIKKVIEQLREMI